MKKKKHYLLVLSAPRFTTSIVIDCGGGGGCQMMESEVAPARLPAFLICLSLISRLSNKALPVFITLYGTPFLSSERSLRFYTPINQLLLTYD